MITESKSKVVISMYTNAKIPEPFCRRAEKPLRAEAAGSAAEPARPAAAPAAVSAAEAGVSSEQKQQDTLPLLAFLLMEFFH